MTTSIRHSFALEKVTANGLLF